MRLVIGFNGHGQSSRAKTGVGKLLAKIESRCPEMETRLFGWRIETKSLAKWIASLKLESLYIVGYSYGMYTGVLLCRELQKLGIKVDCFFSLDGVFRLRDRWGSWKSLRDCWIISIPSNVNLVVSWRQKVSKPSGHRLLVDHRTTTYDSRSINVRHSEVDDAQEIHDSIVAFFCDPPTPDGKL